MQKYTYETLQHCKPLNPESVVTESEKSCRRYVQIPYDALSLCLR